MTLFATKAKWHIAQNNEPQGQYSSEELAPLFQQGRFGPQDLAWREGMAEWQPIGQIPELSELFRQVPAPPPAPAAPPPAAPAVTPSSTSRPPVSPGPSPKSETRSAPRMHDSGFYEQVTREADIAPSPIPERKQEYRPRPETRLTRDHSAAMEVRAGFVDARPILRKIDNEVWSRLDAERKSIADKLRAAAERASVECYIVDTSPYQYPAIVHAVAWIPFQGQPTVTERIGMIIRMRLCPFHRFEILYDIEISNKGHQKTFTDLRALPDEYLDGVIGSLFRDEKLPKFKRLGIRKIPWHLHLPKNKVKVLGKDWASIGNQLLVALGFVTLMFGVGLLFLILAVIFTYLLNKRKLVVRSAGRPVDNPRFLRGRGYWHRTILGHGNEAHLLEDEFWKLLNDAKPEQFQWQRDRIRELQDDRLISIDRILVSRNRAMVFCDFYRNGDDIFVGWESFYNAGSWKEVTLAKGFDKELGRPVEVRHVDKDTVRETEFDFRDLEMLQEWVHSHIVRIVKQFMRERRLEQELDTVPVRSDHVVVSKGDSKGSKGGVKGLAGFAKAMKRS